MAASPERPPVFLVVDDETFIRSILVRLIEAIRFTAGRDAGGARVIGVDGRRAGSPLQLAPRVIQARDGAEAVEALQANEVDCIIADFQMPAMNGLELLQAVRSGATRAPRAVPFAMVTGWADAELVRSAMALDVNAFLAKPVAASALSGRLARTLGEAWTPRDAADYRGVPVPTRQARGAAAGPAHTYMMPKARPAAAAAAPTRPAIRRQLGDLPPGAVLARPINNDHGEALLTEGTPMSRRTINRLVDLRDVGVTVDEVWVYVDSLPVAQPQPA